MPVHAKRQICSAAVKKVFVPLYNHSIIKAQSKEGKPPHNFVRFVVNEKEKVWGKRPSDNRMLFINDHRKTTYMAAQAEKASILRPQSTKGRVTPKVSLAKAVRLPACVVVIERETEEGVVTFINLFSLEGKKASGVLVAFPQFLVEEKLFLDKIVKYEPMWWWGGRKNTSFGPSGDTLPVVALTDESRKIIFHCRKSRDIVTIGSEVKTESPLSL